MLAAVLHPRTILRFHETRRAAGRMRMSSYLTVEIGPRAEQGALQSKISRRQCSVVAVGKMVTDGRREKQRQPAQRVNPRCWRRRSEKIS